jgi:hypothetical protein
VNLTSGRQFGLTLSDPDESAALLAALAAPA